MKERIITGVIAGSAFIGLLIVGNYWFAGLILGMAIIAHFEFMKMNGIALGSSISIFSLIALVTIVGPWKQLFGWQLSIEGLIWFLLFGLFAMTVITKNKSTLDHAALAFIGTFYIGYGFNAMIETRLDHGLFWTVFVFVGIWISDSGAYFTGRAFGKNKLWPSISPNKTIEGAIGGILLTMITAIIFTLFAPEQMSLIRAAFIGLLIAVAGQFGDLIESAYKRVRDIKDSGHLLPGHGGVLDRTDSWLIVFPLLLLLDLLP